MTAPSSPADRLNGALKRVPVLPLYFVALIPGAWAFWQALSGAIGADPVRALEHALGLYALQFMIATLAVTPLRERLGVNFLRFRRMLGLTAFYYALAHLGAWMAFDRNFNWLAIVADLTKRPYIIVGMIALLLMIPLAATSFDRAIRTLGAVRWRNLHRLGYLAALAMALHYLWLVKSWTGEPLTYAFIVIALVGYRLLPKKPKRRGGRSSDALAKPVRESTLRV